MQGDLDPLAQIRALNQSAAFNRWCGIEVVSAEPGKVEIAIPWQGALGQYSGFLHAGLIGPQAAELGAGVSGDHAPSIMP